MGFKKLDNNSVRTYFKRFHTDTSDDDLPFPDHTEIELVVIIPSKNESFLDHTLRSLNQCITSVKFGVIVVVNASANDPANVKDQNLKTFNSISELAIELTYPTYQVLFNDIDEKYAGVGNARKIGMDLALRQFLSTDCNGVIVNLDADCTVSKNYIDAIHEAFIKVDEEMLAIIYFEHHEENNLLQRRKIEDYELHLRYYVNGLRYANYPYSMHTVGSCMAVSASAYARFGGMNRKKAGEDFYFIHKLAPQLLHVNISDAIVFPSARNSDRVPFGTGASMVKMDRSIEQFITYDPKCFIRLKKLVNDCSKPTFYKTPDISEALSRDFMEKVDFPSQYERIRKNTSTYEAFKKQFFQWFDGFLAMKYIHFCTDQEYSKVTVNKACMELLRLLKIDSNDDLLNQYRQLDRSFNTLGKVIAERHIEI